MHLGLISNVFSQCNSKKSAFPHLKRSSNQKEIRPTVKFNSNSILIEIHVGGSNVKEISIVSPIVYLSYIAYISYLTELSLFSVDRIDIASGNWKI